MSDAVFVDAPARLHFGVLDLRGARGRWFGGVGAAAPAPTVLVSAAPHDTLEVTGPDRERAQAAAERFAAAVGIARGARIHVHRMVPPHAGLGSGTQLALAVARALAELQGVDMCAAALARAVGRGRRSGIGTWIFEGGGLVVEGGHRPGEDAVPPLLARVALPDAWRCVVAVPETQPGLNGAREEAAFAELPPPPEREVEQVSHVVLMGLLPAAVDGDLCAFGRALSAIQAINGRWFAPVQGGQFAGALSEEIARRMTEWGAYGVGQSSWGPAVYGIAGTAEAGQRLADRLSERFGGQGAVHVGPFRGTGARVWRGGILPSH